MTEEERLTELARVIWNNLSSICGDYSDVPFEHIMRRPRYEGLRAMLLRTASEVIPLI